MSKEYNLISDFDYRIIAAFFAGLDRQGPGDDAQTRRALSFIDGLPPRPRIADIGCGTGRQTAVLASALDRPLTALDQLPEKINALLEPLFLPLVQALLFVLLCMIVRWVFALLVRLLRGVNLIPLVGGANRLLGLVLGLVTGAFDCWLLAMLLWFAASITTGQIDWLTTGVLQRSVGYSLFGAFNPFLLHY